MARMRELQQTAAALRESERSFRTIFEKAHDGILIADAETKRIVEANRTMCEMLGYGRKELLGLGISRLQREENLPGVLAAFEKLRSGETPLAEEVPVLRRDSTLFYADISAALVDMAGKPCLVGFFRDSTGRRRTEEALKAQEKRLAESQRIARIGSWEHNLSTNRAFWSDELFRLLGLDPERDSEDFDLFFSMVHPEDQPRLKKAIEETLRLRKPYSIEYRFVLQDGTIRIIRAKAELIPDSAGKLVVLSGTAQDITEQKRAEMRLRASEDKFRTIFDKANDGILIADAETKGFVEANRTICEMLGFGKTELLGMGVRDLHRQEDLPAVQAIFERQVRGEISLVENIPVQRRDGTLFFADINAVVTEVDGRPCMVGIFRDSTERRQAEEKLRQSEVFVRSILDSVDEGFIVVDQAYHILTANRSYCEQVRMDDEQVVGRRCFEVSHQRSTPCHEDGLECCVRAVFASGQPQTRCCHEDAAGAPRHVEARAFPLKDSSGEVSRVIQVVSDITEKRLLEEERLKVQKLEAIGTLAGGIAHDFNNLLQGVFGYISLAKLAAAHRDPQESAAALEEAEKALHLSIRLTNQLLTFSKGGKPVKKPTDLRPVIDNAVRFALSGSQAGCHIEESEELWQVEGDEGQIGQLLQNIILNAAQAMPDGGRVEISARNLGPAGFEPGQELRPGPYVEIVVRDQGEGIAVKDLPRIFDPYFTTKEKGSGLGLATSYSIARNHGGMIKAASEPGQGATFFIYLPASDARRQQEQPPEASSGSSRPGRFLLMDDELMVCKVATALIRKLGHEVEIAMNGEEAVAKYRAAMESGNVFDAVILDLTVRGGMGGAETARQLRALDPEVRAAVSSGYADDAVVAKHREYGFTAFLNKPYTIDQLDDLLRDLLNG